MSDTFNGGYAIVADIDSHKPLIEKLARKSILVIDDEGMITKTLCDLLNRAGFYADASSDGLDAVEKAESAVFDLIICDIKMPGLDGVQTIKRVREMARVKDRPNVPVIFITGYPNSQAAADAKKLGCCLINFTNLSII